MKKQKDKRAPVSTLTIIIILFILVALVFMFVGAKLQQNIDAGSQTGDTTQQVGEH